MKAQTPRLPQEEERRGSRLRETQTEALQYVGEEEQDGAVYAVYLRNTNTQQTPVKVLVLRAGTLQKLVYHLLDSRILGDTTYIPAFLATYRTFTCTNEVLRILLHRSEIDSCGHNYDIHKCSDEDVNSLFCAWMTQYPEDFSSLDTEKRQQLSRLLKGNMWKKLQELQVGEKDAKDSSNALAHETGPSDPLDILTFQAGHVAEQLTSMEASLFLRVVPYECLGSVWSRRDKAGSNWNRCQSVRETVQHFNRLSGAVTSSCVRDPQLKPQQRARIIEKWMKVAEECRSLRNFSSVYAIITALQSTAVHRLKKVWTETSREILRSYQEMREVFSEKDNYARMRELLFQSQDQPEITSKRQQPRARDSRTVQGVVPYLGVFLTDLVMLDSAIRDQLENGYLNFEKRRKEFEALSQIRILQSVCQGYRLHSDPHFITWFQKLQQISEAESYQLSCDIEPTQDTVTMSNPPKPKVVITHCTDLLAAIAAPFGPSMHVVSWDTPCDGKMTLSLSPHKKSPSVPALDTQSSPKLPIKGLLALSPAARTHRRSASCGSAINASAEPHPSLDHTAEQSSLIGSNAEHRIIRVQVEPAEESSVYKSVRISSQEKAPAVIDRILRKHHMSSQGPHELIQLLPEGKELVIPGKANVFYAMSSASLDFILRPHQTTSLTSSTDTPAPSKMFISATIPKVKAKAGDLARALF
ncbi:ral guanine nucleotide dissociation stimulator-like 2 isoform X2 [Xenopus laevis]|uniref:Ral guanine nucleotide dissociation stimulator-like 2 isoform X2 n=1 Tax=Xenopus laevis TaxID=8355 RepID=A0A8J0TJ26_XENLA|nr:ral guanine nucleotide dissociation stimulator-like 2 isoform X2 [Xenopus laevis]